MTNPPRKGTSFSERLAWARELRGLTRAELAAKSGLTVSGLSRLEGFSKGSTEAKSVFQLARALEVRPDWLWSGEEPMELEPGERRLAEIRRRLESGDIHDPRLEEALSRAPQDRVIVAVASGLARGGERHTVEGWIARLEEIRTTLEPLLPG
ncbi:MAG: helix-turn-helix domain-containing protein [Polyangiaceae bacterium]